MARQAPAERRTGVRLPPAPPPRGGEYKPKVTYYDFDLPSFFKLFGGSFDENPPRGSSTGLNIYETRDELIVEAPVPGVKKDEITVEIANGMVKIDAVHRETEKDKKGKAAIYRAQRMSEFHYSTTLPKEVKEGEAKAKLEDGILKVSIPLKTAVKKRRSTVPVEGE